MHCAGGRSVDGKTVGEEEEEEEAREGDKTSVHPAIPYVLYVEGDAGGYMWFVREEKTCFER